MHPSSLLFQPNEQYRFSTPTPFDVLCGKDKSYARNPGNQIFRAVIDAHSRRYVQAPSKQIRMDITQEVVAHMNTVYRARFLKFKDGGWREITTAAARDKVSHALRFAAKQRGKSCPSNAAQSLSQIVGLAPPLSTSSPARESAQQPSSDSTVDNFVDSSLAHYFSHQQTLRSLQLGVPSRSEPFIPMEETRLSINHAETAETAFDLLRSAEIRGFFDVDEGTTGT